MAEKFVALIPARSGSVGLPDKNILEISGKSLLQLAVDCVIENPAIQDVYVSSDSAEYLNSLTASKKPINLIFRDPAAATSDSTAADVVNDFLQKVDLRDNDFVVYLQPTSPLRSADQVASAIELINEMGESSLISVVRASQHPLKAVNIIGRKVHLTSIESAPSANRQTLPSVYFPNGAIYIFRVKLFRQIAAFPIEGALAFEMSKRDSLDVDDKLDYLIAKYLVENNVF